jgi:hypothetical protein
MLVHGTPDPPAERAYRMGTSIVRDCGRAALYTLGMLSYNLCASGRKTGLGTLSGALGQASLRPAGGSTEGNTHR